MRALTNKEGAVNYPEKIYNKFEIIEKNILGETFYSVYQLKSIFGVKYKRLKRISVNSFNDCLGDFDRFGQRYVKLSAARDAIDMDNNMKEYKFKKKVLN